MKSLIPFFFALLICSVAVAAEPVVTIGEPDCLVSNPKPGQDERITWTGGCKDGFASGHGTLQWYANEVPGSRYEGAMENGRENGVGVLTRKNGDKIEGNFKNGRLNGQVKISYSNGAKYEGETKDGRYDGNGSMLYANGTTFVGDFKNGLPEGSGVYVYADGFRYEGEVKNGKKSGKGILRSANGDEYQGEFKDSLKDGIGSMVFMTGGRYDGAWKQGKPEGKGTLVFAGSGKTYEGEFKDGLPLGSTRSKPPVLQYSLKEDMPATGTNVRKAIASGGGLPFHKTYAELTPDEKQNLSLLYPALEEGDEPPFPAHGLKHVYGALSALYGKLRTSGHLILYVNVDSEGKATSVSVVSSPSPELTKYAAAVVMLEKYKPAVCGGKPCSMAFGYNTVLKD